MLPLSLSTYASTLLVFYFFLFPHPVCVCMCVRVIVLRPLLKHACTFYCRHVTELLGGQQYVSCSVVLPALCHLSRVMESSDDDPIYVVKFKDTFTADLANRKENTNLKMLKIATLCDPRFKDLKCLPKEVRGEVWALLRSLMLEAKGGMRSASVRRETEDPKKKRMPPVLLASSDTDSEEEEEESIDKALDRYRAEPKLQMGDCPLNWWSGRQHTRDAYRNSKETPVNPSYHSGVTGQLRSVQVFPVLGTKGCHIF